MIIFCTGMLRSASTWSFNVCRLVLQAASQDFHAGYVGEEKQVDDYIAQFDNSQKVLLLKTHSPGPQSLKAIASRQAKNIYTYRDPRDSLCSLLSFMEEAKFESKLVGYISNYFKYEWYQNNSDTLFLGFDEITGNPQTAIIKIANYLGFDLSAEDYLAIAEETSLENSKKITESIQAMKTEDVLNIGSHVIDKTSLLHKGHVSEAKTGRWVDDLTPEQQLVANCVFKHWLIDFKYETETNFRQIISRLLEEVDWQKQAQQYLQAQEYFKASSIYENAISIYPEIQSSYWYLGLLLLLQGKEERAQNVWMSLLAEAEPEIMDDWMMELQQILTTEAERQENSAEFTKALSIRQYIREISPEDINNLLSILHNLICLNRLDKETLEELAIIDALEKQDVDFDKQLLSNIQAKLLTSSEQNPWLGKLISL